MSLYDKEAEAFRLENEAAWRTKDGAYTVPFSGTWKVGDGLHKVEAGSIVYYPAVKKCNCGSESVGSPRHSDWCDKYVKDEIA